MLETMPDASLQSLIKFLRITGILKQTERTGWVEVGVYQPESVADHTFRTAFLCMLYADMEDLDPLKLVRMALIHDLPEAVIGDLTPSQKTAETREDEENAINQILSLLPKSQREKYLEVWKEYQEGETREAKAVRQLEKIEMALQAKEYQKLGTDDKNLERFIKSAEEATVWPELKRLLSCVLEERQHEL
ncbi:MAG TPA: HD domain-containing protein [Candidatus Bathyarchaeota archaeon]|nr:HD domain-containing protein [Candidatus Bathyarchaeota archaeon]